MNEQRKILIEKVNRLKILLNFLQKSKIIRPIEYAPKYDFHDKFFFPLDFQIFMEIIGTPHIDGERNHWFTLEYFDHDNVVDSNDFEKNWVILI